MIIYNPKQQDIAKQIYPQARISNWKDWKRGYKRVEGNIAVRDYYKPGRHFMVYEKLI